jgi:hypothetical protein
MAARFGVSGVTRYRFGGHTRSRRSHGASSQNAGRRDAPASLLAVAGPGGSPGYVLTTPIDLPTPAGSARFGQQALVLANGNFVIVDSDRGPGRGTAYLYCGATNQLVGTLTGRTIASH